MAAKLPPSRRVPEGFPYALDDAALEEAVAMFADALRETTRTSGVGYRNEGIVRGYGTLLDVGRGEMFRRHLRRSELLSRWALGISIGAAVITTTLAVTSVVIATRDTTPTRVTEVRDRLPVDAGARGLQVLETIRERLDEQLRTSATAAETLRAIRRELKLRQPPRG